ncbi:MAG: patatin-like phospholipase family protein [Vicinamibacterales bacterium]
MAGRERSRLAVLLSLFPHLYALRVPIALTLLLGLLPALAFATAARPMLAGLYDVAPSGMFVLTLLNFTAAWTLLLTSWMILAYAPLRLRCAALFDAPPVPPRAWFVWSPIVALPNIVAAIVYSRAASRAELLPLILWSISGVCASVALLWVIRRTARQMRGRRLPIAGTVADWLYENPSLGAGYVRKTPDGPVFRRGHGTAALVALVAFVVWAVTGWFTFNVDLGYPKWVFTLSYVVMLILLLCATLPGVTFLFDRYRMPVIVPIIALPFLVGQCTRSDHFYELQTIEAIQPATAGETLGANRRDKAIVIAINGGGIQAAAWAAQVLTGLEERARAEKIGSFAEAVRLISSVSGGSVGAAYFLNQYDPARGFKPAAEMESIRGAAQSSSLHAVGWGLLYWDIRRPYIPWSVGLFNDRGFALERAWRRVEGLDGKLSTWRAGVREGHRPAVIFNATSADIGTRFLFSNARVGEKEGQADFHQSYPGKDVLISTAVRLSATFPYVSPVARAYDGRLLPDEPHIADGGYYDAYGVASLVEWLNAALTDEQSSTAIKSVLVIEVRGDQRPEPKEDQTNHPQSRDRDRVTGAEHRSWSYQLHAPLGAMLEVRTAGQIAHNEAELCLLIKRWQLDPRRIHIRRLLLEFPEASPPLSWHLTRRERDRIRDEWNRLMAQPCPWGTVRSFLTNEGVTTGTCDTPRCTATN